MQKGLLEKSVQELLDNFPIYKMVEMVSPHLGSHGYQNMLGDYMDYGIVFIVSVWLQLVFL